VLLSSTTRTFRAGVVCTVDGLLNHSRTRRGCKPPRVKNERSADRRVAVAQI
jgi:hypothetical protein